MLQPHELLRLAATIVEAGWASGCRAQDATGRRVPLFTGDARATVNLAAARFSAYGISSRGALKSRLRWLRVPATKTKRRQVNDLAALFVLRYTDVFLTIIL